MPVAVAGAALQYLAFFVQQPDADVSKRLAVFQALGEQFKLRGKAMQ